MALSAALFDLLAILILAAKRPEDIATGAPVGFLSVKELRREITRHAGGTMSLPLADPEHVIKTVYRLRKQIGMALFPKEGAEQFAKKLIEKTNLGYRIGTAPENAHLKILGDPSDGNIERL
jgi:hypothetical protein